ncbi:Bug family tripartite tricarboxylate transporter substrate binding protein [Falsiroseomonas selenitidurans]|uniref:Tripartite tricarboxylate transporter substrate binding protein n=1 Tax=Falsiroseomonas selenitidurans TaxID=2716335 RepID=A0ABX1E376_9PROT|nr:tripartite tricarboxylate transporter substrate binding protein [Falsiroseomonas selenitidurans]NKC31140.1 tripartite tricarboxylate transporter substrate binding protein [Falsiroseomonas selenitidurans]
MLGGLTAMGTGALAALPARAQQATYPSRPIRMIVPFAPGGGVDAVGRVVAQRLTERMGVPVVIENRSGASGTVGGQVVQTAAADGYTLLFSASTHVMARQVLRRAPYDPLADFTPVAQIGAAPMLLVLSPNRPQASITEIVADARRNPEQWTFGASALGSAGHLATILFLKLAGLDLVVAPYRGTAPALTDVAAGNVQMMIDPVLALLPLVQSGGVKGVAITAAARSTLAPNLPTTAEAGMPGLVFASWYGVWGPKDLPAPIATTLEGHLGEIMREPAMVRRFTALGLEPVYSAGEAFRGFIAADVSRNSELLRSANFHPD